MDKEQLQNQYNEFCQNIGIDPEALINVFYNKVVKEQRVPFELSIEMPRQPLDDPMHTIRRIDPAECSALLENESPLNTAIILSLLEPTKAAVLLENMNQDKQAETASFMAKGFCFADTVIKAIADDFMHKLANRMDTPAQYCGGCDFTAQIMTLIPYKLEKKLLDQISKTDKDIADAIHEKMFLFDDIVMLCDKDIQKCLREIDCTEMAKALKNADEEVKNKIFRNMSERAAKMLQEDMDYMGPVRPKDAEQAQQKIVSIIRRLEENGDIVIMRPGDMNDII